MLTVIRVGVVIVASLSIACGGKAGSPTNPTAVATTTSVTTTSTSTTSTTTSTTTTTVAPTGAVPTSGTYSFFFGVSPSCAVPDAFRRRTWTISVTADAGGLYSAGLPAFIAGTISRSGFSVAAITIVESTATTRFSVTGAGGHGGIGIGGPSGGVVIDGTAFGIFTFADLSSGAYGECVAPDHLFTLTQLR